MDSEIKTILDKHGDAIAFSALQISVLANAVEALIASHPDHARVQNVFDQLLGQLQSSPVWASYSDEERRTIRAFVAKLFSPFSDTPA